MEANGHDRKGLVMFLEFLGTALFVWGVLCTQEAISIPFSLFASVVIFGDITGGHFNPAVTLGVFTSRGDYGANILFCILIMLSQFAGGFAAIGLAWAGTLDLPNDKLPALAPTNPATGLADTSAEDNDFKMFFAVMVNEVVCTFLFISVILMVKGKHTAGDRVGVVAAACVVATLMCVISGTNRLGACFNPALGTGLTTYSVLRTDTEDNNYLYHYLWCYIIGPYIGGLAAGMFHMLHAKAFEPKDGTRGDFSPDSQQRLMSHE